MAEEEKGKRYEELLDEGIRQGTEGNFGKAVQSLEAAIAIRDDDPDAFYNLGVVLGHLAAASMKVRHGFRVWDKSRVPTAVLIDKALFYYQQALDLDPEYTAALNNMAMLYVLREEKDLAIEALKRSLAIRPDQPEAIRELHDLESY